MRLTHLMDSTLSIYAIDFKNINEKDCKISMEITAICNGDKVVRKMLLQYPFVIPFEKNLKDLFKTDEYNNITIIDIWIKTNGNITLDCEY